MQVRRTKTRTYTACVWTLCLTPPLLACGPDFPMQLTDDRAASLAHFPEPSFALYLRDLAEDLAPLPNAAETFSDQYDYQQDRLILATEQAEQQLLSLEASTLVAQMRQQTSAAAALEIGAALPDELRLYTAAAVAFSKQQPTLAIDLFRQVLQLPGADQQQRRSWALYSLARLLKQQTDATAQTEALALWQQLRSEVAAGLADPLQLAVASLGESARVLKQQGDWQQAIGLYAFQAGYAESGRASLLQLSRELLTLDDSALQSLLQAQPKVAALLSTYLLTQYSGFSYADPAPVQRVLSLLSAETNLRLAHATALAAIYYQQAEFDLAKQLLAQAADSPLRFWLQAKLAVRDQDFPAAAALYAKAANAFPTQLPQPTLAPERFTEVDVPTQIQRQHQATQCRIQAEAGVLQLQRGDYVAAMQLLYQSGAEYWQDTAYIAERVLYTDELKQFVDQQVGQGQPKAPSDWNYFGDTEPNTLLRQLLARRLLREQRFDEALTYFVEPELRTSAQQYIRSVKQSQSNGISRLGQRLGFNWGHLDQAAALFTQAQLSRQHGLELLGYEMAPDYAVFYGQYEFWQPETPPVLALPVPKAELQRISQSQAQPARRFHYRYVAAELAQQSADLVPANSQAFAATLCHASRWLIDRDPTEAQRYYQRYLNQGPYVPWGADFGRHCPAPDFAAAAKRLEHNTWQAMRQELRPFKPFWPLPLVLLAGVFGWYWRRKH